MNQVSESEYSELLDFINQCPVGLVKTNAKGEIELLNAFGSQILIPLSLYCKCGLGNIKAILRFFDPSLIDLIDSYKESYGRICEERRFDLSKIENAKSQFFSVTVIKISESVYQYVIKDISALVKKEQELQDLIEASAMQAGKLEMSTGLLHDIGNAVTAFGTEVVKLKNSLEWREFQDLEKLAQLFETKTEALDSALGNGKGTALEKFVKAIGKSLGQKNEQIALSANKLYDNTSHIQDVLNIQRHYVRDKKKGEREELAFDGLLDQALIIQEGSLLKRGIEIIKIYPPQLPSISGDKTRLIQVLINLLKNAGESFDLAPEIVSKQIKIHLYINEDENTLNCEIADNAAGFEPEQAEALFAKGISTKESGTGFGLYNCKQIINSHQGAIKIASDGPMLGATVIISLPLTNTNI